MADEITFEEITARIVKESGNVDIGGLPFGDHVMWYGMQDVSEQGDGTSVVTTRGTTVFRVAQPLPMAATLTVFQIYADEDEIRVYAAPNKEAAKAGKQEALRCFHLSKKAPVYFVENMPLDAFITAIASELSVLAYDMTPVDREREQIAEFIREEAKTGRSSPYEMADRIESGEYAEDDEEEEDAPAPAPPAGPSAVATPGGNPG